MAAYFIAQINFRDKAGYQKYLEGFDSIFAKFTGEVLLVEDHPVVLEGKYKHDRLVMIKFPDKEELRRWYDSPEYQELAKIRRKVSAADIIMVEAEE